MTTATLQKVDASDLRHRVRSLIEAALGDQLEAAILFGSQARGDATEDSDWDVLVVIHEDADEKIAGNRLTRLRGDLVVELGEAVDFVLLKWSMADDFAPLLLNVLEDGQRL